jgi:hypothetical protein
MIPYGQTQRKYKVHPANECSLCAETKIIKGRARREQKRIVEDELAKEKTITWNQN